MYNTSLVLYPVRITARIVGLSPELRIVDKYMHISCVVRGMSDYIHTYIWKTSSNSSFCYKAVLGLPYFEVTRFYYNFLY